MGDGESELELTLDAFGTIVESYTQDAKPQTTVTGSFTIDTNPGRFIEPGTAALDARVEWFDPGNVWPAWGVRIDEATWWTVP